jgi:transposase
MKSLPVFVGMDYHQDSVRVCVMDPAGNVLADRDCANDWREISRLARRHGAVRRAGVEACTGSADLAEELAVEAGWPVALSHPGFVSRMKKGSDKHDKGDARVQADLLRVGYLPEVWLAPGPVRELRRVFRFRQQLVDRRRDVKLRVRALLRDQRLVCPGGHSPWGKPWRAWVASGRGQSEASAWVMMGQHLADLKDLDRRVKEVEAKLEEMTAADPVVERLLGQKGVGKVTAWALRAEVGRFDRFKTGKQLSRFCGLSPRNASSGARQADSGLIKAGNPALKGVLVEAAHRLARYDPRWRGLYQGLRASGKPACVATAAVANRWARWLFHRVKDVDPDLG